jgi:pimeloyl-ACP methyl ester carboxylesterase
MLQKVPRMSDAEVRDFVLVHGGFHGGWCFFRVVDVLRARGHRVFAPTLSGLGERSHLATLGVTYTTHVQDVCNVIRWEQLNRVVLCGHSYGGVIITAVADAMPDRIASLVYVDAAIPENGRSVVDLLSVNDRTALLAAPRDPTGKLLMPFPAASFNINPQDRRMVDELCTPHPLNTLTEPIELTGAFERVPKKMFIRATGWEGTHPERSYDRVKRDGAWRAVEIPCGHDVMLDEPARLAELLLEAA